MQHQLIHLSDALSEIKKTEEPFDLTFVTCDKGRGTGGEVETLKGVLYSAKAFKAHALGFTQPDTPAGFIKRQNHREHATINLLLPNGKFRKVHVRLILKLNSKQVIY